MISCFLESRGLDSEDNDDFEDEEDCDDDRTIDTLNI